MVIKRRKCSSVIGCWRLSFFCVLVGWLIGGCSADPSTDSESHWAKNSLKPCVNTSICGDGLRCLCGVCTIQCSDDTTCLAAKVGDQCNEPFSVIGQDCSTSTCQHSLDVRPVSGLFGHAYTACKLDKKGQSLCWNQNNSMFSLPQNHAFKTISIGTYQSCGITLNSALLCWGASSYARQPIANYRMVAVGAYSGCAIDFEGKLVCWDDKSMLPLPKEINQLADAVSVGEGKACAIMTARKNIHCWSIKEGKLIQSYEDRFTAVSVGLSDLVCALDSQSNAQCFGHIQLPEINGGYRKIAMGAVQVCGIDNLGGLHCEGMFEPDIQTLVLDVIVGWDFGCVLTASQEVQCWGLLEAPN